MIGMTKTIARGYGHENILAFAVCPGFTMTGMAEDYVESRGVSKLLADIPLGRVATADEIAETVRWLAVDAPASATGAVIDVNRSEEHTSELQSLMRISYAVFCLKKKNKRKRHDQN